MGIYERRIFPFFLDRAMRAMNPLRAETLAASRGDVLEIGFGTGLNLAYYPESVERLSALDPMDALQDKVAGRIAAAPFPVERFGLSADGGLPFDAGRFDTIVTTWTLCSIPDVATALIDMRRVLKDGGSMLFIEHGRSDDPKVARWQDRLNPIQKVIGCGCNMNRAIDKLVTKAGFNIESLERFRMEKTPAILGEMYRGSAR